MALLVASSNSWAQQAFPDRCGGQAGLPFAAMPRLNRVRSTPTPPEEDDEEE